MNETRRGFLGMLAKVPVLAWLFAAKPAEAISLTPPQHEEVMRRRHEQLDRESLWNPNPLCQMIRWIPVTERLPEFDRAKRKDAGYCLTPNVLVADGTATMIGHRYRRESGEWKWFVIAMEWIPVPEDQVTHWAELPAPPTTQQ